MKALVIGVGNRYRADDGVGPAIAERVRAQAGDAVDVTVMDGASRLLDALDGYRTVVVVDATAATGNGGTIRRFDGRDTTGFVESGVVSTHGFGVAGALRLGDALGRLPERVTVVGVEGESFEQGEGLSARVASAIEDAVKLVLREVGCTSSV